MIRRAVQIKRKLEVKGGKNTVLSEGVKTKRRGVREQRYKVAVKAGAKTVTYRPCSLSSLSPTFRELPEFMLGLIGVDRRSAVNSSVFVLNVP
jgi:hypothetical protein